MEKDSERMRKVSHHFAKSAALDDEAVDRMVRYLRRAHPVKPAECVAARTGGAISVARARKWLEHAAAPDFRALLHLIRAYGAEFLVFVIGDAPESLLEAAMAEQRARILEQRRALEAELESLSSR